MTDSECKCGAKKGEHDVMCRRCFTHMGEFLRSSHKQIAVRERGENKGKWQKGGRR